MKKTQIASDRIISITGTKGKTTTSYLVDEMLRKLNFTTLKVDTTGHFINGERKGTLKESQEKWGLVPTVCPGRFLYELPIGDLKSAAVLECSLGSSNAPGIGYRDHKVGVFLNVFEDHLGSTSRLKTREDIATAKQFIFSRIRPQDGFAVFNADDKLVCSKLELLKEKDAVLIPCGIEFSEFNIKQHLDKGGNAFTIIDKKVVLLSGGEKISVCDLKKSSLTFNGEFLPANINMMFSIAAVFAFHEEVLPEGIKEISERVKLDENSGRLTLFKNKNGVEIITDYAHEKESLKNIGQLSRKLAHEKNGKNIGIVRLAYDRTDNLIFETGQIIADNFDEIVVYDKIDGHFRQPNPGAYTFKENQSVGAVSQKLFDSVISKNQKVTRIVREDEALEFAAKIAKNNDVVVHIVNDDIARSVKFVKEKFNAELI